MARLMHVRRRQVRFQVTTVGRKDLGYVQHGQSHKHATEHTSERIACANTMKALRSTDLFLSRLIGLFAILGARCGWQIRHQDEKAPQLAVRRNDVNAPIQYWRS